jgi:hypothetical protein
MIAKDFPGFFRADRLDRISPDADAVDADRGVGFDAMAEGPGFVGLGVNGGKGEVGSHMLFSKYERTNDQGAKSQSNPKSQ